MKNVGAFSGLRGVLDAPLACTLAVSGDPDGIMNSIVSAYEKMKKKCSDSKYLALVAMLLHNIGSPEELESRVARGKVIYDCLKKRHPINTDSHDTLMTLVLAYNEKPVEAIVDEAEQIYVSLKPIVRGEYAQTCALILTWSDRPAKVKCTRIKELYESLQTDKKNKYSNGPELAVLSALSLIDDDDMTLTDDLLELSNLLSTKEGYLGGLHMTTYNKYLRMMHAAMLEMADNMPEEMYLPEIASIYLSSLYLYELDEAASTAAATMSMMTQ